MVKSGNKQSEEHISKRIESRKRNNPIWNSNKNKCEKCGVFLGKSSHNCEENIQRAIQNGFKKEQEGYWKGKKRPDMGEKLSKILKGRKMPEGYRPWNYTGGNWRTWHNYARRKMAEHIGRKLNRGEIVHHINGKWFGEENNKIENLQLMSMAEHIKIHQIHLKSPIIGIKGMTPWNKGLKIGPNPEQSKKMKGRTPWNKGLNLKGGKSERNRY